MEILPNLPEQNVPIAPNKAESVPAKAANWLLAHRQNAQKHIPEFIHEHARVAHLPEHKVDPTEAPEKYFKRRHEELTESGR